MQTVQKRLGRGGGGKSSQIATCLMKLSGCNAVTEFLTNISGLELQMRTLSLVKENKNKTPYSIDFHDSKYFGESLCEVTLRGYPYPSDDT